MEQNNSGYDKKEESERVNWRAGENETKQKEWKKEIRRCRIAHISGIWNSPIV